MMITDAGKYIRVEMYITVEEAEELEGELDALRNTMTPCEFITNVIDAIISSVEAGA